MNVSMIVLFETWFVSLNQIDQTDAASSNKPKNLIIDYKITIDDQASHKVYVETSIENNMHPDEIVLGRGGYPSIMPISNLSVLNETGEEKPYQIVLGERGRGEVTCQGLGMEKKTGS